jgi:hypothetical protein
MNWNDRLGVGTGAEIPGQSCSGLCVFQIFDSRTWHARSFPVKNWLIKIDEVRFCDNAVAVSNGFLNILHVLLLFSFVPLRGFAPMKLPGNFTQVLNHGSFGCLICLNVRVSPD